MRIWWYGCGHESWLATAKPTYKKILTRYCAQYRIFWPYAMGDRREEGFPTYTLCLFGLVFDDCSDGFIFTNPKAFPIICRARTGAWVCLSWSWHTYTGRMVIWLSLELRRRGDGDRWVGVDLVMIDGLGASMGLDLPQQNPGAREGGRSWRDIAFNIELRCGWQTRRGICWGFVGVYSVSFWLTTVDDCVTIERHVAYRCTFTIRG